MNDDYDDYDEMNDDYDDDINNTDNNDNKEISDNGLIGEMHIPLGKAIQINNVNLMQYAAKSITILLESNQKNRNTVANRENKIKTVNNQENKINTVNNQETTYFKTPTWTEPMKCTINPENNKKLGNKSFKCAIAASKTSGKNKIRSTNIEKFMNDFDFKDINYPLEKKDYETFENNNPLIKLMIFKTTENEKELLVHYNQTENNDRSIKIDLLLLRNNHHVYITKFQSLSKYVKYN